MSEAEHFLVFVLDGGRYALPLDAIERVVQAVEVTALPNAPAVVLGMIDVEGSVLPVLSLRRRIRLPDREVVPADQYLIAQAGGRRVALVIDEVKTVLTFSAAEIVARGEIDPGFDQIQGVAKLPDGLALIHDLRTFLSLDEANSLDAAMRLEADYAI